MRIIVLHNVATILKKGGGDDLLCDAESEVIPPLIVDLLRRRGHSVELLRTDAGLWAALESRRSSTDLVFNLAEGFGGCNDDEPLVPAILEALAMPFTGASSHAMHLTMDKEATKALVASYGVPVVPHQVFRRLDEAVSSELAYPLIVKPVREEASLGIRQDSVVTTETQLRAKIRTVLTIYRQPALVEPFIEGREISIGLVGNEPTVRVLPPVEFLFPDAPSPMHRIRSYEYKWGGQREIMVRADLRETLMSTLAAHSLQAFTVTGCRDYARLDYRVRTDGQPFLLEVNYNPGIGPNAVGLNNTLTMMAAFEGLSFENLVAEIVATAAARVGCS